MDRIREAWAIIEAVAFHPAALSMIGPWVCITAFGRAFPGLRAHPRVKAIMPAVPPAICAALCLIPDLVFPAEIPLVQRALRGVLVGSASGTAYKLYRTLLREAFVRIYELAIEKITGKKPANGAALLARTPGSTLPPGSPPPEGP